ncbi:T9SS type A sorting domain-containing protein [Pedobacter segetis]|nr:T9SS type A sorting domain-containing protein [Pedobacter segetis]
MAFCSSSVFAQDATYLGGSTAAYPTSDKATIENTVPAGKTSVKIQMWGAGGNGGASGPTPSGANRSSGGGAGAGAYTEINLAVVEGTKFITTVGAAVENPSGNTTGRDGYDSFVTLGGTELGRAAGGKGGGYVSLGTAGAGGAGGATTGGGITSLTGSNGAAGVIGSDGSGGVAIGTGSSGGAGGDGVFPLLGETPNGGATNVFDPTFGNKAGSPGTGIGSGGAGGVGAFNTAVGGSKSGQKGGLGSQGRVIFTYSPIGLPVSLISFNASTSNNQVKFTWETASEANNNRFEIQVSSDNKTYKTVAAIEGHGTTSQRSIYTAYDTNPQNGVNYYKLVQFDNDGKTVELAIKSINFSFANSSSVSVYPNPASGVLNVNINTQSAQTANATLTGSNGVIYLSQPLQLNMGKNISVINLNTKMAPGQYILTLTGNNLRESVKVIIK